LTVICITVIYMYMPVTVIYIYIYARNGHIPGLITAQARPVCALYPDDFTSVYLEYTLVKSSGYIRGAYTEYTLVKSSGCIRGAYTEYTLVKSSGCIRGAYTEYTLVKSPEDVVTLWGVCGATTWTRFRA
jgi:hypothetical protein